MGIFQNSFHEEKKFKPAENKDIVPGCSFFMIFLAPYNINTEEIGKIKLYKVNGNTRIIDFIRNTFPYKKRNILHVYNCVNSLEIDKYLIFEHIWHRHAVIELIYCYEDEKTDKSEYNKIRGFYEFELRNQYLQQIDLPLKNLQNKKELTKKYSIYKGLKVCDFIKDKFNQDLILICDGKTLNEEKTFFDNGLSDSEKEYQIYYIEKTNENISKNGYIIGNYVLITKINENIYKACNINSLKEYAIRENNLKSCDNEQILTKMNSLSNLNYQFLAKYYESFILNNYCYTIMELFLDNNLYNIIQEEKNNNNILNENFVWEIILKISLGIAYLHKNNIFHGNLKSSNIFIVDNGDIKIVDYGFDQILSYEKKDLWGIGYILYELVCKLNLSYKDENILTKKEQIIKSNYLSELNYYSDNLKNALIQLLEKLYSIKDFLVQDYIIRIIEKVGLLPKLYELYPSTVKNPGNNTMNHVYYNILKRNNILNDSIFNLYWNVDSNSWGKDKEKIGANSLDYYPPYGWIGIGLNINRYGTDKNWIDKNNGWATAYHGLRFEKTKDGKYNILNCNKFDLNMKLELTIKSIIENGLKDGINQPFKFERNSFPLSKSQYQKCGEGVYLSFEINEAKKYTEPISGYIFVLMCKVFPNVIRESRRFKGEFVADGNYVRPYRILSQKYE